MKPIALVTGGNRGIGRGIVLALAQRGFDVAFADLAEVEDTQITRDEAAKRGARVAFAVGDIADLAQHERLVDAAYALGGRLDVLVNNAGVSVANRGDVLDVSPESFDRVLGINLRGTFFLSQRAARRMLADPPPEHHRAIVTISSANAVMVSPDRAEYCFSKAALSMMVRILAMRLGPGIVRTQMTRVASEKYDRLIAAGLTPLSRWGEAQDVGRVVGALAAGELPFVTGEAVHVDGGLHIHRL